MSRHKKIYTSEEIAQVEALAAFGHTQEEITEHLGIKERSFLYAKKDNDVLNASYKRGRFKARSFVVSSLMGYIKEKENTALKLTAITFYLRTQAGWSEKSQIDITTKDLPMPSFIFNVRSVEEIRAQVLNISEEERQEKKRLN
jgi:hypothetical protein